MTIKLDLLQHDAPSVFAAQLARATRDELVEVVVGDVDFCPNRVVPIVGVADAYVSRDFDIRFKVPPHCSALPIFAAKKPWTSAQAPAFRACRCAFWSRISI